MAFIIPANWIKYLLEKLQTDPIIVTGISRTNRTPCYAYERARFAFSHASSYKPHTCRDKTQTTNNIDFIRETRYFLGLG